jgi:acyl carrier protein
MMTSQPSLMSDVLDMLQDLAKDWEYSAEITPETRLFEDLGFESLDIVVLGTAIQERYHVLMPFAEFLVEVGQRDERDISVGELVGFVQQHLDGAAGDEEAL